MAQDSGGDQRLMAHLKAGAARDVLSAICEGRWLGTAAELAATADLVAAAAHHARWAEMATAA